MTGSPGGFVGGHSTDYNYMSPKVFHECAAIDFKFTCSGHCDLLKVTFLPNAQNPQDGICKMERANFTDADGVTHMNYFPGESISLMSMGESAYVKGELKYFDAWTHPQGWGDTLSVGYIKCFRSKGRSSGLL